MKIQIAKSPCYPPYGVVVGEQELWCCDCAGSSIEDVMEKVDEIYGDEEVIMFDDPRHYSNQGK